MVRTRKMAKEMEEEVNESMPNVQDQVERKLQSFERLHQEGFSYLADNSYIRSGYRLNYSLADCFRSLFELHNETLNVWTHMVGSLIFVSLMLYLAFGSSLIASSSDAGPSPAWCHDDGLYLHKGLHTPRMAFESSLPDYCPVKQAVEVPEDRKRYYYEVASAIFEHSLHQMPSVERLHGILEEQADGLSYAASTQLQLMRDELSVLQHRLGNATDNAQLRSVKERLSHHVESFSSFLQTIASNVGADLTVQYALEELHGLAGSVRNGLHIMSTVDSHDVPHWPIFVFMGSAAICLTFSAIYHLLFVHSRSAYAILSRLDFGGITIMIAGSFYPVIYYSFYCHPWMLRFYLAAITALAGITFGVTMVPAFGTPKFLVMRTAIFLSLGFFGVIPVSHLIWHFGLFDPHVTVMIGPLLLMGLLYTLGAIIYATKFPERFYPGRFDVWFSSHQLWHVCVLIAALVHFANAVQYYEWRWHTTCHV